MFWRWIRPVIVGLVVLIIFMVIADIYRTSPH